MNVFYVPSWYPDPLGRRLDGIFFQEMVVALARHHPEVKVVVSLWGQTERNLSVSRLGDLIRHPWTALASRPRRRQPRPNLVELWRPTWSWRYRTRRGNIAAILRTNRVQFAAARSEFGPIDVIHAQVSFPAGEVARRLSEETGVPYLISEHMGDFPFVHFLRDGQVVSDVLAPLRAARRVTAVSRALAAQIRERTGVETVIVPNGVDEAFFAPAPSSAAEGCVFLSVAALEPHKGIADLLRAIARLGPRPGLRFRIGGAGPGATAYRALASRLRIADRVEWLGRLDRVQVRDAMRSCDAFVLTSHHESFGLVLAEAIACGKPVVATRCGGPEDIVSEVNGLLAPVRDPEGLARALEAMRERARAYDPAAIRADFQARFSSRVVSRRFVDLYHDVAKAV
jgi:glycosyltransferase involved in cell wall biosynthesis